MKKYRISPQEIVIVLWYHRELIYTLIKREIAARYRGSILGMVWSFLHSSLMLGIYTFVFSVVLKARWNIGNESKTEFALLLFSGLMVFNLFSDCINKAPGIIIANANYVKKVIFPLEILPWVTLGAALFQTLVSLGVWLLFYLVVFGFPHVTILFLPLIIIPVLFIIMGLSWILASLGVYLRDVGQFVSIITTALLFLSPIFYPVSSLPEKYRFLLQYNPLAPAIDAVRDVLYWGDMPNFVNYGIYLAASLLFSWLGFVWFQNTRRGFADVL